MKIFDCFMYYNEDFILDLRLNYLNKFIDFFVIVESLYNHKGEKKNLNFNIKNYQKFKEKIIYIVLDHLPDSIEIINDNDDESTKDGKYILNGYRRDNFQRNYIINGIKNASLDDLILISDIDEIPNLKNLNLGEIKNRLIFFKQRMCYYKFNLYLKSYNWVGTRACKKKNLISPQWLRDIKSRSYPFWRIDTFFSKNKYSDIYFVNNGGWHFSYINSAEGIENKLKSYTHHREYDLNPLGVKKINNMIKNRETVYNLSVDQRANQFGEGQKLDLLEFNELPKYIKDNQNKYKLWLED